MNGTSPVFSDVLLLYNSNYSSLPRIEVKMQKPILGSIIALIIHLITPAATHAIINLRLPPPSSPSPSPSPQSTQSQPSQPPPQQCHDTNPNSPHSFTLRQIAYLQYETSPYTPTPQPNTTQLVFEVVNAIDDVPVSTGCACQNVNWADDSDHWYACLDREVGGRGGGEPKYPVKTSVLVEDWEDWRVRIIQTWACDER
jgi:hypothetical protein